MFNIWYISWYSSVILCQYRNFIYLATGRYRLGSIVSADDDDDDDDDDDNELFLWYGWPTKGV